MFREEEFIEKAKIVKNEIRSQLNQRSIRYSWHEPDVTVLEGFLARGDRRSSKVILKAYEKELSMMPGLKASDMTSGRKLLQKPALTWSFILFVNGTQMRSFPGILLTQA